MKISDRCLEMLKHHEGVRVKPYQDAIGLWTVGVGHLIGDGKTLPDAWNKTFTMEEVNEILRKDIARFEVGVERLCPVGLTQSRFDALVSISFNFGLGTLQRSSIRAKHNREDFEGAADAFLLYNKAGGKELKGLTRRRNDERAVYLSGATHGN
jgi:lysozyme